MFDLTKEELANITPITVFTDTPMEQAQNEELYTIDPYRNMRSCKTGRTNSFLWSDPNSEESRNEIPERGYTVVGLRGFVAHVRAGLMFFDSENKKLACSTVSSELTNGENSYVYHDSMPLSNIVYGPVKYEKDKPEGAPDQPSPDLIKYGLKGELTYSAIDSNLIPGRPSLMSCAECVKGGFHKRSYVDSKGNSQTDNCGGSMQVVFMVSQFGVLNTDWKTQKNSIKWIGFRDMTASEQSEEKLYTRAPSIVMNISRSMAVTAREKMELADDGIPNSKNLMPFARFFKDAQTKGRVIRQDAGGFHQSVAGPVEAFCIPFEMDKSPSPMISSATLFRLNDSLMKQSEIFEIASWVEGEFKKQFEEAGGTYQKGNSLPMASATEKFDIAALAGKPTTKALVESVPSEATEETVAVKETVTKEDSPVLTLEVKAKSTEAVEDSIEKDLESVF